MILESPYPKGIHRMKGEAQSSMGVPGGALVQLRESGKAPGGSVEEVES